MTETTFQRLREQVAKDAGLPAEAASGWIGETQEALGREAIEYVRARRGESGVREVERRFAEVDARETPDEIRRRVVHDLDLHPDLVSRLSPSTKTETEVVDDALSLLKESGGSAALDDGVRKLQGRAMDGQIRGQARSSLTPAFGEEKTDMDSLIRQAAGR